MQRRCVLAQAYAGLTTQGNETLQGLQKIGGLGTWTDIRQKKKEWESANPEKLKIYNERHRNLRKRWAEEHHDRVLELGRINDRKRRKTEKRKAWEKEYRQRPEVKAKRREYDKKRAASPERKAYERERSRRRREQSKLKKEVA